MFVTACGGGGGGGEVKSPGGKMHAGVLHFYPLETSMQWSYRVGEPGGGERILSVTRVIAFDGKTAVLDQGGKTISLRVASDGIVREPSHAYLLKWPITLGDKWAGPEASTVEVSKVDVDLMSDAGTFSGCVETTERYSGDEARMFRTTFCPEVGPVMLEARSLHFVPGEVPQAIVGRLQSFGPAESIGKPGLTATPPGAK